MLSRRFSREPEIAVHRNAHVGSLSPVQAEIAHSIDLN